MNGVVGGHLCEVFNFENTYADSFAERYHGQFVLIDSFQSFYIETIRLAYKWIAENGWPQSCESYSVILLYSVIIFRSFRACEILLTKGYPLDGYALLRDLKDRAVFLGGIAHNITKVSKIIGYEGFKSGTAKKIKKERKNEEYRVLGRMIRRESGLPTDVIAELKKWEQFFHEEVHGSKLTFLIELEQWRKSGISPPIGPLPREDSVGMYMNRAAEIGWMITRLLPFVQPVCNAFGFDWKERQEILDDSFREMEKGLSRVGKSIADAFIIMIDNKFSFSSDFYYFEADGTS